MNKSILSLFFVWLPHLFLPFFLLFVLPYLHCNHAFPARITRSFSTAIILWVEADGNGTFFEFAHRRQKFEIRNGMRLKEGLGKLADSVEGVRVDHRIKGAVDVAAAAREISRRFLN